MVFKKHLTPIGAHKAGNIVKHAGKGSKSQPGSGAQGGYPSFGLNDYTKSTPMANPSPSPVVDTDFDGE